MPSPTTKPTATHHVPLVAAPPPRNLRNIAPHPRLRRPSPLFAAAAREYQERCLEERWALRRPCPYGCRHLPPRAVASSPKLVEFAKAEERQLLRCPGCPAGANQRLRRVVLVSSPTCGFGELTSMVSSPRPHVAGAGSVLTKTTEQVRFACARGVRACERCLIKSERAQTYGTLSRAAGAAAAPASLETKASPTTPDGTLQL
jgi:hypothetical protein